MSKNKRIEIRLSESEFENIAQNSAIANLNKSDYIREMLFNPNPPTFNKKGMADSIVKMQTATNRIIQLGAAEEDLNILLKGMDLLWQYLK